MILDLSKLLQAPPTEPRYIARDIFVRGSMIVLAGEAGVGKSILCYHLSMCVALGRPFLGRTTELTRALYFDEENGGPDCERYLHWVWRGLGCPDPTLLSNMLRFHHFSLGEGWADLMHAEARTFQPGLIVVDTATPALQIEEENDNAEASRKIQTLRSIQREANNETTILVLKHEKQRDDVTHRRTVRGAKTWLGQVDGTVYHTRGPGAPSKSGLRKTALEPDKTRAFGLRQIIEIEPAWTGPEEPRGLVFNAHVAIPRTKTSKEND